MTPWRDDVQASERHCRRRPSSQVWLPARMTNLTGGSPASAARCKEQLLESNEEGGSLFGDLVHVCRVAATVAEQRAAGQQPAPALIVCPPTLVGHWHHEIAKFVAPDVLQPLAVQGPPQVRDTLPHGKKDQRNPELRGHTLPCDRL